MAQAFLHGNGGALRISCKVICSATEPASPRVNTIWVKTSIPINVVAIQPTTPSGASNLVKGNVFIQDKAASWVEPNFNFTNSKNIGMRCFPGLTYQYDGTKWVKKDAYIRQSNKWTQISSEFSASIKVTYPAGSALTCSDGSTTLTATSTSGEYTFTVTKTGTWTVKAVSGSQSASKTVSITSDGQSASVALSYYYYLYNSGNTYSSITGGWEKTQHSDGLSYVAGTLTMSSDCIITDATASANHNVQAKTCNTVNVSGYKTLYVRFRTLTGSKKGVITVSQNRWPNYLTISEKSVSSAGLVAVDISGVTGAVYIIAGVYGSTKAEITEIYLDE